MKRDIRLTISKKQNTWIKSLINNKEIADLESYLLNLLDKDIALNDKWLELYRAINKNSIE